MPGFQQTIIGIGPICDARFTVTFLEDAVVVHDDAKRVILSGCRDPKVPPALWYFNLLPAPEAVPVTAATFHPDILGAYSVYNLPIVASLVRYLYAAAGLPVKDMWLWDIKADKYVTWPGLTYNNAVKYCPNTNATVMGHMVQTRQGVRSTKPRPKKPQKPMTQEELP